MYQHLDQDDPSPLQLKSRSVVKVDWLRTEAPMGLQRRSRCRRRPRSSFRRRPFRGCFTPRPTTSLGLEKCGLVQPNPHGHHHPSAKPPNHQLLSISAAICSSYIRCFHFPLVHENFFFHSLPRLDGLFTEYPHPRSIIGASPQFFCIF